MSTKKRYRFISLAAGLVPAVILVICLSARFDFYYDLNDDWMMEHLLSGAYTGEGELRNIQSLFLLTALLGGLYRLAPSVPWYGIFLILCQAGSFALAATAIAAKVGREISKTEEEREQKEQGERTDKAAGEEDIPDKERETGEAIKNKSKGEKGVVPVMVLAAVFAFCFGLAELFYHLVFVQYSVTVGMLLGAVTVLFLVMDDIRPGTLAGPILLIFLAFCLRSEMTIFLLVFPALAFLYRAAVLETGKRRVESAHEDKEGGKAEEEKSVGKKKKGTASTVIIRCLLVLCVILAGMGVLEGIDHAAYSSSDWKEFRAFFDARTRLYDFYGGAPSYEENKDFYDSIGVTKEQVGLYQNYNFALDSTLDAEKTKVIADYAEERLKEKSTGRERLSTAFWVYTYQRLLGDTDMPFNMLSAVLYGCAIIAVIGGSFGKILATMRGGKADPKKVLAIRKDTFLRVLYIFLVFAARSALYLYLLYNNRPVVRLTHCLYLLEGIILLFLIFEEAGESRASRSVSVAAGVLLFFVFVLAISMQVKSTAGEYERRDEINASYGELLSYADDHPDTFFLADVYSTVDFSEKMFHNTWARPLNWDVAGGWAAKSPLQAKKFARFGIDDAGDALRDNDNVYFVLKKDADVTWLEEFYESENKPAHAQEEDTIGASFTVWRLSAEK